MSRRRVLFIVHNHPSVRPGGAEQYALELYEAFKATDGWEPFLVAKAGPPMSEVASHRAGTIFSRIGDDPNQMFAHTDGVGYNWLLGMLPSRDICTQHFRDLLLALRPDVVHFQHTLHLGYDLIRMVRRTLPDAAIVYTLHEFLPICHRNGQMVRATDGTPCLEPTPRRCNECFPDISPQTFFMRKRLIQSHLAFVDRFIAPSQFLADRYIDWGIATERIVVEEYGRRFIRNGGLLDSTTGSSRLRDRFGYFGQLSLFKGVMVALEAMQLLADGDLDAWAGGDAHTAELAHPRLWVHGANLDLQPGSFQARFHDLVARGGDTVSYAGTYRADDVGRLMSQVDWVIVPSIWWENSPLVIQEAFACRRPVICSDIGGMAEKVLDGVNGLHFAAGDPVSLATKVAAAATTRGLWDRMRAGIPEVYGMPTHVATLASMYEQLIDRPIAVTAEG
jgi:glycosyltransferase involved in cell wall biosynthesis